MKDPVLMDLDEHLRKEERALEIREQAERLADFDIQNPDPDMIREAISLMPDATLKDFCLAMSARDDAEVGRMLRTYTYARLVQYEEDELWAGE